MRQASRVLFCLSMAWWNVHAWMGSSKDSGTGSGTKGAPGGTPSASFFSPPSSDSSGNGPFSVTPREWPVSEGKCVNAKSESPCFSEKTGIPIQNCTDYVTDWQQQVIGWAYGFEGSTCRVYLSSSPVSHPAGWDVEDNCESSVGVSGDNTTMWKCFQTTYWCMRSKHRRECTIPTFPTSSPATDSPPTQFPPTATPTTSPPTQGPGTHTSMPDVSSPDPDRTSASPAVTETPLSTPPAGSPFAASISPTLLPTTTPQQFVDSCKCIQPDWGCRHDHFFCANRQVDWSGGGRHCAAVQAPGQRCQTSWLKCPGEVPFQGDPHGSAGTRCKCQTFVDGAHKGDLVLCVTSGHEHGNQCGLPNVNGTCSEGAEKCSLRNSIRILVEGSSHPTEMAPFLATASNVTADEITIYSVCPVTTCPGSTCPCTRKKRMRNCSVPPMQQTRQFQLLEDTSVYVDYDIAVDDEVKHTTLVVSLFNNIQRLKSGEPPDSAEMSMLARLGVSDVDSVLPPIERTTGTITEEEEVDSPWWQGYWWLLLVCTGVVVGVVIIKKKVWFADAVDFAASRKRNGKDRLSRGMEGCYREHRGKRRGRVAGAPSDETEMCIDLPEAAPVYRSYPETSGMSFLPGVGRGSKPGGARSRSASSTESSGSSEPEMMI
ncbi:hypothetical protein DIPPA_11331 [Diplonema papillatum]|nr:hypothetical protein DIPPA_11331 [Diplonema papillatum]